jgi:hypothetical protein
MAIDERARHQLYLRLEEQLGPEAASTLMEHLPPAGWADVATKRDLDQLADRLRADLYKGLAEQTRTVVLTAALTNVGAVLTVGGLAFAAARLT